MGMILIRYGEIALKSPKVRRKFEKQLENNIKHVLNKNKIPFTLTRLPLQGRIFIDTNKIEKSVEILSNVFGIVSLSPVVRVSSEKTKILDKSLNYAQEIIKEKNSFAIRVRRSGNQNYASQDIANEVGALINEKLKERNVKVNLNNPNVTIFIEIRDNWAYIFDKVIEGLGGFPYNTQDKLVSFFFGDFYSFLSTWLMLRKGCNVIPIFFEFSALLSENILDHVISVVKYLRKYINSDNFFMYKIPDCANLIKSKKSFENLNETQINLQLMYLIAEKIAQNENAQGIVHYLTFDDIKNLELLEKLEKLVKIPIYRPSLGMNLDDMAKFTEKFDENLFLDQKKIQIYLKKYKISDFKDLNQPQIHSIREIVEELTGNSEKINI